MRAALLDSSGRVSNLIVLDEDSDYTAESGYTLVILNENDPVNMGDLWNDGDWTPPEVPEEPEPGETPLTLEEQLAELKTIVDMLVSAALEG